MNKVDNPSLQIRKMEQSFRDFSRSVKKMVYPRQGMSSSEHNMYIAYIVALIVLSLLIIAYILYYTYRVTYQLDQRGDRLETELKRMKEKEAQEKREREAREAQEKKDREDREKKEREEREKREREEREKSEREWRERELRDRVWREREWRNQTSNDKKLVRYLGVLVECEKIKPADCDKAPYGCCPDGIVDKMDARGHNCGVGAEFLKSDDYKRAMFECGYPYRYPSVDPYGPNSAPIFNAESRRV
jgi:hypothetical protein